MASFERPAAAPRDFSDHGQSVEELALVFAAQDAPTSEALIETLVTQAVQKWKLDDATYWQRVKFHARLIRATRSKNTQPAPRAML